jgi:uncharacterized protein involved in exopolysaccharide biosynthesis
MSNELDLQAYIDALRKRWWLILIFVVSALAIALAVGLAQPRQYQATSTLLVQPPRYQWRFDASILPVVSTNRDYQRELLVVGRSSEIAEQAAATLEAAGRPWATTPEALSAEVSLRAGDGSSILVTASAPDPQQAADVANAWTGAFLQHARQVYGVEEELADFQAQMAAARQRLDQMDQQLAAVRTTTGLYAPTGAPDEVIKLSPNQAQLIEINQLLATYANDLESVRLLQQSLETAQSDADLAQLPWEFLDGQAIAQRGVLSAAIARASLDDPAALLEELQDEEASLAATSARLAAESERIQASVAADWQLYDEAQRERNLARDTYLILARKVNELAVQQEVDPGLLSLVSQATAPSSPVRTRQFAQLVTAGAIGLILGVLAALWLELGPGRRKNEGLSGTTAPAN